MASQVSDDGMPLSCNICTKKPQFSDLSHLLTHIASKGHLSTYYNIKIRSASEEACRLIIEDYDNWYAKWRIEGLMSHRLTQKDLKRSMRARPKSEPVRDQTSSIITAYAPQPPYALSRRFTDAIKIESQTAAMSVTDPALLTNSFGRSMPMWSTSNHLQPGFTTYHHERGFDLSTPYPLFGGFRPYATSYDMPSAFVEEENAESATDPGSFEASKLKGTVWPGMDMFDAATPEAKRMRNQKKVVNVSAQLEAISQDIEPTEHVFSRSGDLRKSRHIDDLLLSDISLVSGEEPLPKSAAKQASRKNPTEKGDKSGPVRKLASSRQSRRKTPKDTALLAKDLNALPTRRQKGKKRSFQIFEDGQESSAIDSPHSRQRAPVKRRRTVSDQENRPPAPVSFRYADPAPIDEDEHAFGPIHSYMNPAAMEPFSSSAWAVLSRELAAPLLDSMYVGAVSEDEDENDAHRRRSQAITASHK